MSTLRANTLSNVAGTKTVSTDTVVDGSAKAWVNFNGTGTVAIRGSFNVSSITDLGPGEYVINFTNNMADGNYVIASGIDVISGGGWSLPAIHHTIKPTATGFRTYIAALLGGTNTLTDFPYIMYAVFR